MTIFPLETERLWIRPWQPSQDAAPAFDIYGDPRVTAWIGNKTRCQTLDQVRDRLQHYCDRLCIEAGSIQAGSIEAGSIQAGSPGAGSIQAGSKAGSSKAGSSKAGTGCWAVVTKDRDRVIGNILLIQLPDSEGNPSGDYEIGWHFRPVSWGQGYATEAARRIVTYGFQTLKMPVLYAVAMVGNQRSTRVMERLAMTPLGTTTRYYGGVELLLYRLDRP